MSNFSGNNQLFRVPGTSIYVDTINEKTSGSGVTLDSLTIKDSRPVYNSTWLAASATKTANASLIVNDSGNVFVDSSAAAVIITIPASAVGISYNIICSNGGNAINISPAAADKIVGLANAGTTDKDLILATPVVGDYVKLIGAGTNVWYVMEASGTFTREV